MGDATGDLAPCLLLGTRRHTAYRRYCRCQVSGACTGSHCLAALSRETLRCSCGRRPSGSGSGVVDSLTTPARACFINQKPRLSKFRPRKPLWRFSFRPKTSPFVQTEQSWDLVGLNSISFTSVVSKAAHPCWSCQKGGRRETSLLASGAA